MYARPPERAAMLDRFVEDARLLERAPRDRDAARRLADTATEIAEQLSDLNQDEFANRFADLGTALRSAARGDARQIPDLAAHFVVAIELMRHRLDATSGPGAHSDIFGQPAHQAPSAGMEAADEAFMSLNAGTSRLVQLLADELVPLDTTSLNEISQVIARLQNSLPALINWDAPLSSPDDWLLEPPFNQIAVRRTTAADFEDIENVERMRRSFDLLAPQSLALRKETAILLVDALLGQLRSH